MFGLAWSEILLIGAVALVVIGPKDLPKVMRTMGQWSRRLRVLASDFQRHVDDMVKQAELDEIKRNAEEATGVGSIGREIEAAVDAPGIEKSMKPDEASVAASVPPVASAPAASSTENPAPPAADSAPISDAEPAHADHASAARETTP